MQYKARTNRSSKMSRNGEEKGDFKYFQITQRTVANLKKNGFMYLFPIQQKSYNPIYTKKDVIGKDRTGSGKTLAFALPLLERMKVVDKLFNKRNGQRPLIMVLVPTRELALQVTTEFNKLRNEPDEFRVLSIYGGTPINNQIDRLKRGVEVVVGTPGRVMDLQRRGNLKLNQLQTIILDETDQMLNFGFKEDIETIIKGANSDLQSEGRRKEELQYLLFSATMPEWVRGIVNQFMKPNLILVDMVGESTVRTSKTVQHLKMFFRSHFDKIDAIPSIIQRYAGEGRCIVFTETKREANEIGRNKDLGLCIKALHGDIDQRKREFIYNDFRSGRVMNIVATNVAARGLDVPNVELVIQLCPPKNSEDYIHRSGRTGRAGNKGVCVTLFTGKESDNIRKIERNAKIRLKEVDVPQKGSKNLNKASKQSASNYNKSEEDWGAWDAPRKKKSEDFGWGTVSNKDSKKSKYSNVSSKNMMISDSDSYKQKKARQPYIDRKRHKANNDGERPKSLNQNARLIINNINDVNLAKLKSFLSSHNIFPIDVYIANDRNKKPKGYGFLSFNTIQEADAAIKKLNGKALQGSILRVSYAKHNNK